MSDAPRTDLNHLTVETLRTMKGTGTKIVLASVARQLERELNAATERIKRLENAGNDLVWWFCQKEESQLSSMQSVALKQWRDLRVGRNP